MKKNKFQMTAYTGAVVESPYFGSMIIDLSGIRYSEKIPALFQHQADRPAGVIDNIEKSSTLTARGYFTTTPDGKMVYGLIKEGYPYQASIGIWADEIEILDKKETAQVNGRTFPGPGAIWRKSHLREISFVSLGRDADTSVSIAASAAMPTAPYNNLTAQVERLKGQGLTATEAYKKIHKEQPDLCQRNLEAAKQQVKDSHDGRRAAIAIFHGKAMEIQGRENCTYLEAHKKVELENPEIFRRAYS